MKHILFALVVIFGMSATLACTVFLVHQHRQGTVIHQFIASGPANLTREEAAARREGIPLTAQQLQQSLPPADQNAAPLYTKLTKLLHDRPLGLPKYAEGMDALHSYTPAQIAAVRRTLAARQDVMTLVHEAADKPQCVFVRDWNKGRDLAWPEYQALLASAWLLKTESYLLARDGQYQSAIANQSRGFRIAAHAASDPVLIEYLVGIACESRTLSGMQSILTLAGPNSAVAQAVQKSDRNAPPRPSLRSAMAGETGFDCLSFARMHHSERYGVQEVMFVGGLSPEKPTAAQLVSPAEQVRVHDLIDGWQADFLSRMRQAVHACDSSAATRRAVFAALGEQPELPDPETSVRLASYVLLPVFSRMDLNDTRTRAREAVTLAAAAVLAARARTGTFPAALPSQFTDPFTEKPLGYHRDGAGGFIVYSAGPTGRFDGGKPSEKTPPQESLFRYPPARLPITPDMLK